MPALPWKAISTVPANTEVTVMASHLPLRSHRSIPRFLRWTLRIRRQLASTPGLVGYALDAHLFAKQFWTVSAWTGRPELHQFDRAEPHSVAVKTIRPLMDRSTFVTWTTTASDLPIRWNEVRRRIGDAQAARSRNESTQRVGVRPG